MNGIEIIKGDITTASVDAIVNAANPMMLGGGGVDGAIHKAAGPSLLAACTRVTPINGVRCPFGEARITCAGALPVKFVIHAVGPRYRQEKEPQKLLASAYRHALSLALENKCASIAFPAISCGAYGYPGAEAAKIAVSVCREERYKNLDIHFYLFSQELYEYWQHEIERIKMK